MIPHLITGGIAVVCLSGAARLVYLGHTTRNIYGWKDRYAFSWPFVAFPGIVFAIIFVVNICAPVYSEHSCTRWGEATERDTRFIHPTYWSWSCTVHTDEGWVDRDAIVKVDD